MREVDQKKLLKILRVRMLLENNAKKSARRNLHGLSASSFNRITRNELKCYPDLIRVGNQLIMVTFKGH